VCQSAQLTSVACGPDLEEPVLIGWRRSASLHSCDNYSHDRDRCQVIFVTDMEASVTTNFALWLRTQIDERDLSATKLAGMMRVRPSAVSMWLSGERSPTSKSSKAIAVALGIDEDVALVAAGHKSPDPHFDPDGPTARLSPLIEKIDWASRPGRLEEMENELRFMIDTDRRRHLHKKSEG